jgi:hypothetical protein
LVPTGTGEKRAASTAAATSEFLFHIVFLLRTRPSSRIAQPKR